MAASWQQGYDVSSGSGANGWQEEEWNNDETYSFSLVDVSASLSQGANGDHIFQSAEVLDDENLENLSYSATFGSSELPHGALMSPKIPPAFSGRESWFAYEELMIGLTVAPWKLSFVGLRLKTVPTEKLQPTSLCLIGTA